MSAPVGIGTAVPQRAPDRRLVIWLVVLCSSVFLLISSGSIGGSDGRAMYETTRSLVDHGRLDIAPSLGFPGRGGRSYASHGLGLPLVSIVPYALSRPIADLSSHREAVSEAITSSLMPIIAGLLVGALFMLARRLGAWRGSSITIAVGSVAGTYLFPYVKDFYSEPLATLFVVVAVERALARRALWAGVAAGMAFLTRPQLFPLALLVLWASWRLEGKGAAARASVPLALAVALALAYNALRFSDPLRFDPVQGGVGFGSGLAHGAVGLLFFPTKSIFLFAPVVILLPAALWWLWRAERTAFWLLGGNLLSTFVIAAAWPAWDGGWVWGPRLLLPALVPALAALAPCTDEGASRRRLALAFLLVLGFLVSLSGVIVSTRAQLAHPPPHGPSVIRQYLILAPAIRRTSSNVYGHEAPERYLDLWQVKGARVAGRAGLLAGMGLSAVVGAFAIFAAGRLRRSWREGRETSPPSRRALQGEA